MLESRLCLSAIRVVTWNVANGPNNAQEDADFQTVLAAIGNKNIQGNTAAPSIVALQETDTSQFGGNSIARVESILESVYPGSDYRHTVSPLDSGDDANGFVFDAAVVQLVSTRVVPRLPGMQNFAHNNLRAQFRPTGSAGEQDFYIYSTHLKAGSSGEDRDRREAEAEAIRADMDALGADQEILVMGDFNISGSSEGAYRNFLAGGDGQLRDPINRPGEWKNNFSFRPIHTQNPQIGGPGGMDDRFDFQLGTAAVFDTAGLQYIQGSYEAFGNNGTHTFNSNITTGTGASSTVLAALAAASDHLPVVADYEIGTALPGIIIESGGGSTTVVEGGPSDAYTVALESVPTADVTITLSSDSQTIVDPPTLLFTPANALTPQTVTVTAVDDTVTEGTHVSRITHDASSADASYDQLSPVTLDAIVTDNDSPSVVISEIMYNPDSSEPDAEWVEIVNLGPGNVNISGWLLDDEDTSNWGAIDPCATPLSPGDVAIIHSDAIDSATFRSRWSIPADVKVAGVTWGSLANSPSDTSEVLELLDAAGGVQDVVNYDDNGTVWPADNGRSSITLTNLLADNNQGSNWALSTIGVNNGRNPTGAPFSTSDIASPGYYPPLPIEAPTVAEVHFDSDSTQRSLLRELNLVVDQAVTVDPNAFEVLALDTGALPTPVDVNVDVAQQSGQTRITLTFSGDQVDDASGSLRDGNYQLTIQSGAIATALGGVELDGDQSGAAGGSYVLGDDAADNFFRFYGDIDGDRDVDGVDYLGFAQTFLRSADEPSFLAILDADTDGDVDGLDYGRFVENFLRQI